MSSADDAHALVRAYFAALNRHDLASLDLSVAAAVVRHEGRGCAGIAGLKEDLTAFWQAFPDLTCEVLEVLVDADRVAVRTVTRGTHLGVFLGHLPTGKEFVASSINIIRFQNRLVTELWTLFDTMSMLVQLGLHQPKSEEVRVKAMMHEAPRRAPAKEDRRPPGPRTVFKAAAVRTNPLEFLSRLTRDYGDHVSYITDGRPAILVNCPDSIRHVLNDHSENFSKQNTPDLALLRPMLGDGLLTSEGPDWRHARQWLQPLFRHSKVQQYGDLMVRVTNDMLERWDMRLDHDDPLEMVMEMSRLTLEIFARTLFSTDFRSQSGEFGSAMEVLNESLGHAEPQSTLVRERFAAALRSIRCMVWQLLLARKIHDSGENDLVANLLEAQRQHGHDDRYLVDQAMTMMLAGHETTAKALGWTLGLLDRHPGAREKLTAELDERLGDRPATAADLPKLNLTMAAIYEGLRLYPPVWLISRSTSADDEIGGYAIPAGALIVMSPYLLHRHDQLWERAEEFVIERFLHGEQDIAWKSFRYLPFSVGARHCIGKYFALLEMPLVLATICHKLTLRLDSVYQLEPEALVTLRPRYGLPMTPTARRVAVPVNR